MERSKKRILIIDDELIVVNALTFTFSNEGFETLVAKDGEEGLAVALKEQPDLILLDIRMPKMDGMTMLKKLRADELGKSVPVIILTNSIRAEKVAAALEGEVFDYLVKSNWNLKDVVVKVKEKLGLPAFEPQE